MTEQHNPTEQALLKALEPMRPQPARVNNRNLVSVRIRGLAFKCRALSQRHIVLLALKWQAEHGLDPTLLATVSAVGGGCVGILTAWWFL